MATQNKKIFQAKLSKVDISNLEERIKQLSLLVEGNNKKQEIKEFLMKLVLLYKN
jgi:hypothetical protein